MDWRPPNWEGIVNDYKDPSATYYSGYDFEAGANVMLETLKAKAPYGARGELITMEDAAMRLTDTLPAYALEYGWLVFIPDEE